MYYHNFIFPSDFHATQNSASRHPDTLFTLTNAENSAAFHHTAYEWMLLMEQATPSERTACA